MLVQSEGRVSIWGGAQTFMGLAAIKKIIIPIPQIELQKQFAEFVTQVDKSKVILLTLQY